MARYPVCLPFGRIIINHVENATQTFSPRSWVDHNHFCAVHAICKMVPPILNDNDLMEAVDRIKLHLVPQVSVPGTNSVWPWVLVTVNGKFCTLGAASRTQRAALRYSQGSDRSCSWDEENMSPLPTSQVVSCFNWGESCLQNERSLKKFNRLSDDQNEKLAVYSSE